MFPLQVLSTGPIQHLPPPQHLVRSVSSNYLLHPTAASPHDPAALPAMGTAAAAPTRVKADTVATDQNLAIAESKFDITGSGLDARKRAWETDLTRPAASFLR